MAAGEIGALIFGLICAVAAVLFFSSLATPLKVAGFFVAWYAVTKCLLWFVHLGYDSTMKPTS